MAEITPDLQAWLGALRSGMYEQGTGHLATIQRGGNKYCCLGLLCDLHKDALHLSRSYDDLFISYNGMVGNLPPAVAKAYNISRNGLFTLDHYLRQVIGAINDNPFVSYMSIPLHSNSTSLTALNDARVPFGIIADVIEHAVKNDLFEKYDPMSPLEREITTLESSMSSQLPL